MTTLPNDDGPIVGFRGQWYGLSPSAPLNRPISEYLHASQLRYPTVRKAYHAARTHDVTLKAHIIAARTQEDFERLIPKLPDNPEWALIKERVMYRLLQEKFQDASTKQLLLKTGTRVLMHRSDTNDRYWGVDKNGEGYNRYGVLLMRLRDHFRSQAQAA